MKKYEFILEVSPKEVMDLGLTINEYTFLHLFRQNLPDCIHNLIPAVGPVIHSLTEKGLIVWLDKEFTEDFRHLALTKKAVDTIFFDFNTGLNLLMGKYPKSETRNGGRVSLQKNKQGIQNSFKRTITSKIKLNKALQAIDFILEEKQKAGSKAAYLCDLQVFLNQKRWEVYEELMKEPLIGKENATFMGGKTSITL